MVRQERAICVHMKHLVCHSVNPHGKIKKLWENNGMVHFVAPFTLPAGVSSTPSVTNCVTPTCLIVFQPGFARLGEGLSVMPSLYLSVR